jgi:hypothetical protein
MRTIVSASFVAVVLIGACSQNTNFSQRIVSKKERPLASLVNPHVDAVNVLVIDGKRFERVRGVEKFYLVVPKMNAVLFVVDENNYFVTYHIFKMDTGEDIQIKAANSIFGRCIGMPNSCDAVEEAGDGKIVLSDSGQDTDAMRKSLIYLDLARKTVVAEKTIFYDKAGKVIRENDKSPPF